MKEQSYDENPLISIIVPVYKVPYNMLIRCLDSISNQTVKNFEAILVDDGSPDDCGKICDKYATENPNFRVIHQENAGLSVVRNTGIDSAKGKWICFVDGDDWIEPNSMEFAEQYTCECGDGDVLIWEEIIDTDGILKYNCFFEKPLDGIVCFEGKEINTLIDKFFPRYCEPLKGEQYTDMGSTLGRLYNVAFLKKNNLRNVVGLKRMQDNIFNLWVFDAADKIYYQTKHLYHYCCNYDSATKKYTPDFGVTLRNLYKNYMLFIDEKHCGKDYQDYKQRLYCKFIVIFGQLFELDYASPMNKSSYISRIKKIRKEFKYPEFDEVVRLVDVKGQRFKIKALRFLLLHKLYGLSLVVCILNKKFRPSRRTMV